MAWQTFDLPEEQSSTTWGDWFSTFGNVGGADVLGALPAGTRYLAEQGEGPLAEAIAASSEYLQNSIRRYGDESFDELSPRMQELLTAEVTSPEFWASPAASSMAKLTRMSPSMLASVMAGVVTGGGALAATVGAGAVSGGLSAGQTLDDIYSHVDQLPDAELREKVPMYRDARDAGMDEKAARQELTQAMIGAKPAVLFALGAVTGAIGPAGQIARGIVGGAEREVAKGIGRRAAEGFVVGAGSEGVQSGAEGYATEDALVSGQFQDDVDWGNVASGAAEGALLGGIMGGVADGALGGRRNPRARADESIEVADPIVIEAASPEPATAEPAPVQPTPAAETVIQTSKTRGKKGGPKVTVAEPGVPAPDEAAAISAAAPTTGDVPGDIAKAARRVATDGMAMPAPAQPAPAPQVPQGVAEAAQRVANPQAPVTPGVTGPQPVPLPDPIAAASQRVAAAQPQPEPVPVAPPAESARAQTQAFPEAPAPTAEPPAPIPATEAARAPRILMSKEQEALSDEYAKANAANVRSNVQTMEKEEAGPQGKKWTKAEKEEREQRADIAREIFEESAPALAIDQIPTSAVQRTAFRAAIDDIVRRAEEAGVKIPTKVGYDTTADHVVWLADVKRLARKFAGRKPPSVDEISEFMVRDRAARGGDFSVLREGRRAEGEQSMRRGQGEPAEQADTSANAATEEQAAAREALPEESSAVDKDSNDTTDRSGTGAEKDAVVTKAASSAKRSIKSYDEETAKEVASKVRKVEATEDIKAKALAALETAARRGAARADTTRTIDDAPAPKVTPKVTPKVAAVKERVAAAAAKTDRTPSDAQKVAGNYQKGSVSVQGLDITIETPKGAERSGTSPDGRAWSVKSPAHYGYIKRTLGADGDQVDVYVGPHPDSPHVFVLDQVDPDTGAFDEHKAFVGFKTIADALQVYDKAFSDGRAFDRMGSAPSVMTVDEFKSWLKTDTTKPVVDEAVVAEAEVDAVADTAWAQPYADEVSGRVVYADAETALIEGYSPSNGRPVYSGAKRGVGRTMTDIDIYRGDAFTAPELANLRGRRTAAVDESNIAAERNPDGPFQNGARVVGSEGIDPGIVSLARQLLQALGINTRVFITRPGDIRSPGAIDRYALHGPYSAIRSAGLVNEGGGVRQLSNGDYNIILTDNPRRSATIETLAHEIGHIVDREALSSADVGTTTALMEAHKRWLQEHGEKPAQDYVRQLRAHIVGKQFKTDVNRPGKTLPYYWQSFNEWFADNVAKWATTEKEPNGIVEKFFSRIAQAYRRMLSVLGAKGSLPDPDVREFLNDRVERAKKSTIGVTSEGTADLSAQMRTEMSAPDGWGEVDTTPETFTHFPDGENIDDYLKQYGTGDGRVRTSVAVPQRAHTVVTFDQAATGVMSDVDFIRELGLEGADQTVGVGELLGRLGEHISDMPVYLLTDTEFDKLGGANGYPALGFYSAADHFIALRDSVLDSSTDKAAHVLLHEGVHAALMKALWQKGNENVRHALEQIAKEARRALGDGTADNTYAFTNVDEFVAEALSNPEFRRFLAKTPASMVTKVRLASGRLARPNLRAAISLWDSFKAAVSKALGLTKVSDTLLDAVLQATAELELDIRQERAGAITDPDSISALYMDRQTLRDAGRPWRPADAEIKDFTSPMFVAADRLADALKRPQLQEQTGSPRLLSWRTLDDLARTSDRYFKGNNPVRNIADILEMTRTAASRNLRKAEAVISKSYALERKYKGKVWTDFASLLMDETQFGVYADRSLADNTHLGKDALHGVQGKAQHAQLAARHARLPDELKQLRRELLTHYAQQQDAMSLGIIKNRILKALGVADDGLAQRIHEDRVTDADRQLVGDHTMDLILEAKELTKLKGPYVPMARFGNYVVRGTISIKPPANGVQVEPNVFEFSGVDARKKAIAFAERQGTRAEIKSRWVDKTSGERFVKDENGKDVRITPQDTDAEQRFRVTVQDRHVEFFDTKKAALAAAAELQGEGLNIEGVEERRFEPGDRQADMLSHQMQTLVTALERREGYRDMTPAMKNELVQALNEASIRFLGSTRIQSRRLQRRYVEGASKDVTMTLFQYSRSTSGYLAKLEYQPQLDDALKALDKPGDGVSYDKTTSLGRSALANEVKRRVHTNNGFSEGGRFSPAINRILTMSFIDKLASISYSVVNSTQNIMLTGPVLAGRYGVGRAVAAMSRAYSDIGAAEIIGKGAKDTWAKAKSPSAEPDTYFGAVRKRLKNDKERAMLDYLAERGVIDPEVGFEVEKLLSARNQETIGERALHATDASLGYLEGIARQMPKAVEAVNRMAAALTAYRLELARTKNHGAAVLYAQDIVNSTHFNYSPTNSPAIFNHPLARLPLQFKKFALNVYQLLGQQIGKAIRNENPGDRAEALKSLGYLAVMHTVMAGTLGLPTEPFKALLMGANLVGLTGFTWADFEDLERQAAAELFGKDLGEIITRGVTRGLPGGAAFDMSSRVGLDNMLIFGEPDSNKTDDVWGWVADVMAGAPGSLAKDWHKGLSKLAEGDVVGAAEKLVPIKTFADGIKAYKMLTEGKQSAAGDQTMVPYNIPEAVVRAIGFTPGREAENTARRSVTYRQQTAEKDARTRTLQEWAAATPNERAKMWGTIERANRSRPRDQRITRSDLDKYVKRKATEARKGTVKEGIRSTKRDRHIADRTADTYNY